MKFPLVRRSTYEALQAKAHAEANASAEYARALNREIDRLCEEEAETHSKLVDAEDYNDLLRDRVQKLKRDGLAHGLKRTKPPTAISFTADTKDKAKALVSALEDVGMDADIIPGTANGKFLVASTISVEEEVAS